MYAITIVVIPIALVPLWSDKPQQKNFNIFLTAVTPKFENRLPHYGAYTHFRKDLAIASLH